MEGEKTGVRGCQGMGGGRWWLPVTSHLTMKREGNWPCEADGCCAAVILAWPYACDLKGPAYAAEPRLVAVEVVVLASSVGSWSGAMC